MNIDRDLSLAFPWPLPADIRGPGVRTVVADPVWRGSVRLAVERWRKAAGRRLPIVAFDSVESISNTSNKAQLVDVVQVGRDSILDTAGWIDARRVQRNLAVLLCRQSLCNEADRKTASDLLREAGAAAVIATPRHLHLLAELIDQVCTVRDRIEDSLLDLPLTCWGPAWQQVR